MKCRVYRCRKLARPNDCLCHKHRMRLWRERHPVRAMYHKVKWSAKLRDIPFLLTFEEFSLFDDLHDYVNRVGISGENITIDRIDEKGPYSWGNIQVLTKSQNVAKQNHFRRNSRRNRSPARAA